FDPVQVDLAAEQSLGFGGLHREQAHVGVGGAQRLADAAQGAAGADAVHEGVGQAAVGQLGQDLRAEDLAALLHVPLRLELAGEGRGWFAAWRARWSASWAWRLPRRSSSGP